MERFAEQDATDHFYSLHSNAAIAKLKSMRPLDAKEDVPSVDPIDKGKGTMREQKEGIHRRKSFKGENERDTCA